MTIEEFMQRNTALRHAIQTGLAMEGYENQLKHLRVGLNANMCEVTAIVKLLIDKGVITEEEYFDYSLRILEAEVESMEQGLSKRFGRTVKLV